jgi:hypothetical protein
MLDFKIEHDHFLAHPIQVFIYNQSVIGCLSLWIAVRAAK